MLKKIFIYYSINFFVMYFVELNFLQIKNNENYIYIF